MIWTIISKPRKNMHIFIAHIHVCSTLCFTLSLVLNKLQAPVVWRLDNAIHWVNLYLVVVRFAITYPPDSNLSVGQRYLTFIQLGPDRQGKDSSTRFKLLKQKESRTWSLQLVIQGIFLQTIKRMHSVLYCCCMQ